MQQIIGPFFRQELLKMRNPRSQDIEEGPQLRAYNDPQTHMPIVQSTAEVVLNLCRVEFSRTSDYSCSPTSLDYMTQFAFLYSGFVNVN